jgi:YaiO family outer membrane protein
MFRYFSLYVVGLIIAGLCNTFPLLSQNIEDPEAEYARIKTIAHGGDFVNAASAARTLVNMYPSYGDARVLLARILAWQEDFDLALAVIDTLLTTDPSNKDAISAKEDILLWMKSDNPSTTDLRTAYSFDSFTEPYSRFWQLFKLGAGHKFDWGDAAASLNTGHVILGEPSPATATELQIEAEAYPKIADKNYAYLSYAYSAGDYFPGHRASVEIWQVLPAAWSISAGLNYYYFDRNIYIAGASVEKYIGKFWLSAKTFIYFKDDGPTSSGYINARRYFTDDNYLQLMLGTGTAPDEPYDIQADLMRLSANSLRIAYNRKISQFSVRISAGYSIEEYDESVWRNRFDGGLSIFYALRKRQ